MGSPGVRPGILAPAAKRVATLQSRPFSNPSDNTRPIRLGHAAAIYNCGRRVRASQHRRCFCPLTGGRPGGPKDETTTAAVCPPLVIGTVRPHCPCLLQCSLRPADDARGWPYFDLALRAHGEMERHLTLLLAKVARVARVARVSIRRRSGSMRPLASAAAEYTL